MSTMRKIGLLGATGYTGRLTATELATRGLDVRLGGRSAARLKQVDATEGSQRVTVDTCDPSALAAFLDGLDVVISTVGPFTSLGRPVVDAAVAAGVHYVDSTGEPGFMQELYDVFGNAKTAVVPACGFDYVPGDCAASVAVAALGVDPDEVRVGYSIKGMRPTRGTTRSAIEATLAEPSPRLRRTEIEGQPALELAWGEQAMVPRWAPGAVVRCAITAPRIATVVAPIAGRATGPIMKLSAPLLRRLVERMPEGPTDDVRASAKTRVVATARTGSSTATAAVEVNDVYAFTALSLVECALRVDGNGAMTPAQAFNAGELLDAMTGPLLSWQRPVAA
jgi:short subunit dehydrogenase-like uncharacterized protein